MSDQADQPPTATDPATALVVKITCGVEAPERLNQAFTVAALAAASGVATSVWLTGEAVRVATPGHAEAFVLPLATPLAELRDTVLAEGRVTACTQCLGRRDLTAADLISGVVVGGAAGFLAEVLAPGARTLVY
jgi:predicted peroxiredoxin